MKYKVGDKVRIKKNLIVGGNYGGETYVKDMEESAKDHDYVLTVSKVFDCYGDNIEYAMTEDDGYYWTDRMIEGLVEPTDREKFEGWMRELSSLSVISGIWNSFNNLTLLSPTDDEYENNLEDVADYLFGSKKKKMTKAEIEKELGYEIEIVEE